MVEIGAEIKRVEHEDSCPFIEFDVKQGSPEWLKLKKRKGCLSASNAWVAAEGTHYKSQKALADEIFYPELIHDIPSEVAIQRMNWGNLHEPLARSWFEKTYNIKVREVGMFIPKWDERLSASPDGLISKDGVIEIKCPKRMYTE